MSKIVIAVRGGSVTGVWSDHKDDEVIVVDYDNHLEYDPLPDEIIGKTEIW